MTETTQSTASLRTLLPRIFSRAQPTGAVDRLIKTVRAHHPKADIPLLVEHFVRKHNRRLHTGVERVDASAMKVILAYPWPGNVRELENLLHRAVAMSDGDDLQVDFAPTQATQSVTAAPTPLFEVAEPPIPPDLQAWLDFQERDILVRALQDSGFNRTAAASRLGLSLRQIRYRIARLGIAMPGGDDTSFET